MFDYIVVSDLDGTLFHESRQTELSPDVFEMIRSLKASSALFCIASGRSYRSLSRLFAPVKDEILFLCENGALTYYQGVLTEVIDMPRPDCEALLSQIAVCPDCYPRVNTPDASYLIVQDAVTAGKLMEIEGAKAAMVSGLSEIPGKITQITAISIEGPVYPAAEKLVPVWRERLGAAVTGEHWLDFTAAGKGKGLKKVCEHMQIPLKNSIVFGDFFNDEPMLDLAGVPFIMEGAPEKLLAKYPNHCASVPEAVKNFFKF